MHRSPYGRLIFRNVAIIDIWYLIAPFLTSFFQASSLIIKAAARFSHCFLNRSLRSVAKVHSSSLVGLVLSSPARTRLQWNRPIPHDRYLAQLKVSELASRRRSNFVPLLGGRKSIRTLLYCTLGVATVTVADGPEQATMLPALYPKDHT